MADIRDNSHSGHRQRVRDKFIAEGSFKSFPPHNILEMLLFYSIPRSDTNELAHKLIETFGSFKGVFDADYNALLSVDGVGEQTAVLIKMTYSIMKAYQEDCVAGMKYITNTDEAVRYLRPKFRQLNKESLLMICMNNEGKILKTSLISTGGSNFTEVDTRQIIQELLLSNATVAIISHNHPGGLCTPSMADKDITFRISNILPTISARLIDHIIISENEHFSLAANDKYKSCFKIKTPDEARCAYEINLNGGPDSDRNY